MRSVLLAALLLSPVRALAAPEPAPCASMILVQDEADSKSARSAVPTPRAADAATWTLSAHGSLVTGTLELRFDAREGDATGEVELRAALPPRVHVTGAAATVDGVALDLRRFSAGRTQPPDRRQPGDRRGAPDAPAVLEGAWRAERVSVGDTVLRLDVEMEAPLAAGAFRLMLPPIPGACGADPSTSTRLAVQLDVVASSRVAPAGASDPALSFDEADGGGARITLADPDALDGQGAVAVPIAWSLAGGDDTASQAWARTRPDGRREVTLVVTAPAAPAAERVRSKDVTFVLDASGSMRIAKLDEAKRALLQVVGSLREDDGVNVLAFADGVTPSSDAPETGPAARERVSSFLAGVTAHGSTKLAPALGRALQARREGAGQRLVVVLSDGILADEADVLPLLEGTDSARLLLVAIGKDAKLDSLRRIAEAGRGEALVAPSADAVVEAVTSLMQSFARPVAWDLAVDWDGVTPLALHPARIPDLHADRPVVVRALLEPHARVPARLRVRGTTVDGTETFDVYVDVIEQDAP
jgi:Mg-chelatase subunit ChlD